MKFAQIAIGSILFIEAVLLLYSPQQRYNFHSFFQVIKSQANECHWQCPWLSNIGYECIESVRFFVAALIISGAYSLTLGNNIIVGILAQLLWTVIQSQLYYEQGLKEARNTLVQILFLVILLGELRSEWRQCNKKQESLRKQQKLEQQKLSKREEVPKTKQSKKQSTQKSKKVQQKGEKKQENKKNK